MQVVDVPTAQSLLWIRDAWRLFKVAPFAWMGLTAGWIALTLGLLLIPVLGQLAANLLQPIFFAGFMIAARAQESGEVPRMVHLFAAFRVNAVPLISVGTVMFLATLAIIVMMALLGLPEIPTTADGSLDMEGLRTAFSGKEWLIILGLALISLVKGALWFAPPLLAFHKMSAAHAMRWSIYAFVSNFGAVLLYGVLVVVIYALAILPYGAGLFIAMPLMVISNYTSYKAMFREDGQGSSAAAPAPGDRE